MRFTNDDIELLRNNIPLSRHVVRMAQKDSTVQNNNRSFTFPVMGLDPSIQEIWNLDIAQGRFLNDADNMQHGLYAVIASEARDKLFSGMPAVGESIRIDGVTFEVIGVGAPRMQEGDNDNNRVVYIPYNSMDVLKDNHYLDGIWMDSSGLDHDKLARTIRGTLATAHSFKPDDQRAVFVFDAQKQLSQFGIITLALKVLLAFIGTVTLGIGGVGLMNIMLVSVTQRTREIGVEKALGARRHDILFQFLVGSDGHYGRRRASWNCAVLRGFDHGGAHHFLQCDGVARRGCGHSADRVSHDLVGGDFHSGGGGRDQRNGSGHARRQSGSDRSLRYE